MKTLHHTKFPRKIYSILNETVFIEFNKTEFKIKLKKMQ